MIGGLSYVSFSTDFRAKRKMPKGRQQQSLLGTAGSTKTETETETYQQRHISRDRDRDIRRGRRPVHRVETEFD